MIRAAVRTLLGAWACLASPAVPADTVAKAVVEGDQIAWPKRAGDDECAGTATAAQPGDRITLHARAGRVRRDRGDLTVILRADLHKLFLVYHQQKRFSELRLPVNYGRYFPSGPLGAYDELRRFTVISQTDPLEIVVRGLRATDRSFTVSNALRHQYRVRVVLAEPTADPSGMLLELQKLLNNMRHGGFGWADAVPLGAGVPMVWEEAERQPETEFVYRERIESFEQQEVAGATYEVPAGYEKVRFQAPCAPIR